MIRDSDHPDTPGDAFRGLVDAVTDLGLILLGPDGTIRSWNPGAETVTGYGADRVLGQPLAQFTSGGALELETRKGAGRTERNLDLVQPEGGVLRVEATFTALAGGSGFAVQLRSARAGARGEASHVRPGLAADPIGPRERHPQLSEALIAQKVAETAVRDANELNRQIFASAKVGIIVYDRAMRFIAWNPFLEGLSGKPAAEVVGRLPWEVFPFLIDLGMETYLTRALAGEAVTMPDHNARDPGSEPQWFVANLSPLRNAAGAIVGVLNFLYDINERKHAEQALLASEERYRLAIQATNGAVWDLDLSTPQDLAIRPGSADANPRLERTHQGTPGLEAWQGWIDSLHPADRDRATGSLRAAIAGTDTHWACEYRFRRADGTWALMHDQALIARDPSGRARRVVGAMQDVTSSRQASAERDRLWNHSLDLLCIADFNGYFQQVNPAWISTLGWSETELLGRPWLGLVHPDDHPATVAAADALYRSEPPPPRTPGSVLRGFENRFRRADGSYRWLSWMAFADPQARDLLAIARDVTERKQAEDELRLRDRAIRALAVGLVILSPGSSDPFPPLDYPVLYVSPGFERMMECTSTDILGRDFLQLYGPDRIGESSPVALGQIRAVLGAFPGSFDSPGSSVAAQPRVVEFCIQRADGGSRWIELSLAPVCDDAGRLTHLVGVQTDITTRRELEGQLHQALKMEAIGRLAGGVAHDFNNLLTVINGHCDLLLQALPFDQGVKGEDNPRREALLAIREAGDRAAALTAQLLTFSRKAVVEPRVLDLNEVAEASARWLRRLLGEDVQLTTDLAPAPTLVRLDPSQLDQVLMNLAVNARDAMPAGGRLTLATRTLSLATAIPLDSGDCPPGDYVELTVSDTGEGMTEDVRIRIFEPFFTTKDQGRGTGLGLAMVYGIVRQAGGAIGVASVVGRGSQFRILLPACAVRTRAADEAPLAPSRTMEAPRGTETILLVEDEEGVRRLTRLLLEAQGYTVLEADCGAAACTVAAEHPGPIHLLVTDVVMPDFGGRELVQRLRERLPHLAVVFMSGYADDAFRDRVESGGAFIQKPFTSLALARMVRRALDTPRAPDGSV